MFSLGWLETAVAHRRAAGLPRRSRHANVEKDHASADVVAAVGAGPCGFPACGGGPAHAIRAGPGAGGPPAGAAAGHEEAPGRRVDRPIVRHQPLPGASMLFCRAALPRSADHGGPGGLGGTVRQVPCGRRSPGRPVRSPPGPRPGSSASMVRFSARTSAVSTRPRPPERARSAARQAQSRAGGPARHRARLPGLRSAGLVRRQVPRSVRPFSQRSVVLVPSTRTGAGGCGITPADSTRLWRHSQYRFLHSWPAGWTCR